MAKGMYVSSTTGKKTVKNLMTESAFLNGGTYSNAVQWAGPTSSTQIPYTKGHKIYTRAKISYTGGKVLAGARYWDNSNTFLGQHLSYVVNGYASVIGYMDNATVTKMDFSIQNTVTEKTTKIEYSECLWVDLTACFGTGNEPTKEWCDANIPFFTGETKVLHEQTSPVARKVITPYMGVSNVARKVKSGYVGVNNVARRFFGKSALVANLTVDTITGTKSWEVSPDGYTFTWDFVNGYNSATQVIGFNIFYDDYLTNFGNEVTVEYDLTMDIKSTLGAIEFRDSKGVRMGGNGTAFYYYTPCTDKHFSGIYTASYGVTGIYMTLSCYGNYNRGTLSNLKINGEPVRFVL